MQNPVGQSPQQPVLHVRESTHPQDHRRVLDSYTALNMGESLIVQADYEPQQLRLELERELAGAFEWEALPQQGQNFQVRITKRASTALPRIVANTPALFDSAAGQAGGSVWQLEPGARDLDSNIIILPPDDEIAAHGGPDLDVLILVLDGSGELETELNRIGLQQGSVLWLPKKAQRRFIAGPEGLKYLTVHQRKTTLNISQPPKR